MNDKLTAVGVEQDEFTLDEMLNWVANTHASISGYYFSNMRNGKGIKDQIARHLRLRERWRDGKQVEPDWKRVALELCNQHCDKRMYGACLDTECPRRFESAAPSPVCAEPENERCDKDCICPRCQPAEDSHARNYEDL